MPVVDRVFQLSHYAVKESMLGGIGGYVNHGRIGIVQGADIDVLRIVNCSGIGRRALGGRDKIGGNNA